MSLEKMFAAVDGLQNTASARAVLGEPQQVEGRILIPVAAVRTGLALGFSQDADDQQELPTGPAGGTGGGTSVRPVAIIEIAGGETTIKPIVDEARISMAGLALIAWIVFWLATTLRCIFGKSCCPGEQN